MAALCGLGMFVTLHDCRQRRRHRLPRSRRRPTAPTSTSAAAPSATTPAWAARPTATQFRAMSPDRVLAAMETGSMVTMANGRTAAERRAIAEFLTGKTFATALSTTPAPRAMCTPAQRSAFDPGPDPAWNGWGNDTVEQPLPERRQGRARRGRRAEAEAEVGVRVSRRPAVVLAGHRRRRARCSSAAGAARSTRSTPPPAASTGTTTPARACARRSASGGSDRRRRARTPAFFGDGAAIAHAVDAATGALVWKVQGGRLPRRAHQQLADASTTAGSTCGVASGEEASGAVPTYECCKFRGSLVALDAATGQQRVEDLHGRRSRKPTKKNAVGAQLWGPSGAPVWGTPAIDPVKNAALRHDRQQLQRPRLADERRVRGDGPRHRQDSLAPADDGRPTPTRRRAACPTRPTAPTRTAPTSTSARRPSS